MNEHCYYTDVLAMRALVSRLRWQLVYSDHALDVRHLTPKPNNSNFPNYTFPRCTCLVRRPRYPSMRMRRSWKQPQKH